MLTSVMTTKIKNAIRFHLFLGLVSTGFLSTGDCLPDDVPDTQQCYNIGVDGVCFFVGSEKLSNWKSAYEICEAKDSTLPIIRNADEQNALEKYLKYLRLKRPSTSFVWTAGKMKNFTDWTWINGQAASDKSKFVRRSLFSDIADRTYARMTGNTTVVMTDPDKTAPFLCQFNGEKCNHRDRKKLSNSCATLSNFSDDWFNARLDCLARGGDLAVLSDQDLLHVVKLVKDVPLNFSDQERALFAFWIGLRNMSWVWELDSKGKQAEEILYRKWKQNLYLYYGDECIHAEAFSGNWLRAVCEQKYSIICQRKGSAATDDANHQTSSSCLLLLGVTIAAMVSRLLPLAPQSE